MRAARPVSAARKSWPVDTESMSALRFSLPVVEPRDDVTWLATQEEERERRMDFVPDESAVNTDNIEVRTDCQQQTIYCPYSINTCVPD